ncbi:recombinase family protein [Marinicauda algicola]|uniref:Recombinase family protein n=1 Tax=Marinicauda algicola TaxID=2029849 RepID=A0A4V6RF41_9PROT|nr:recombinase family protein [Marinicauda algicola]TGY88229.1 recombinase family protein [Marinicauda algicola]
MKGAKSRPVGVWIRVSTEDQARGQSPATHRARAEQYAEFRQWHIVEVYDLSGVSGKAVMDHPETKRMLGDIKSGRITGLMFSKLARLARNTRELLEFSEIFRQCGADLISLQENIDTSTPAGRLFYTMIAAMAQWEREEIADRIRASVITRAKLGKQIAGNAPFGYMWKDGEVVLDPDQAPVRALIYELFAEHKRKGTVARILNERGFKTSTGKQFTQQGIQYLLRDPSAKGLRRSNYSTAETRGGSVSLKPEEEWQWHTCEPIVSVELWERCNAILDEQAKGRKPGPRGRYLFAGKVKCEADGQTMYVLNENPKFVCRQCRRKIPQDDLEAIFRDQLKAFFFSPEDVAAYLRSTSSDIQKKEAQISVLERERDAITTDREKVLRSYLDDLISMERFGELDKAAEARLRDINVGIASLEGEIAALEVTGASSEDVIQSAQDLYSRWDDLSYEQKRSVIETIVEEIVIGEQEIAIHLHYVPHPSPPSGDDGNDMKKALSLLPSGSRK